MSARSSTSAIRRHPGRTRREGGAIISAMAASPLELQRKYRLLRWVGGIRWLRGRDRILRAFSHPDRQPSLPFAIESMGVPYTGNLNNFVDWTVFFYGAHARHELMLLAALAKGLKARGGPVNFFDVGANVGAHTLFMSRHADHVFSFEPFDPVRREMQRKLTHAAISNVTVFPFALGDRSEGASYTPPTGANQGTGTLGELLPENAASERIQVDVVRGDDFLRSEQLPPISLLKMDVEGFELKVVEGLKQTLWRDRPPILMEIQQDDRKPGNTGQGMEQLLYPDHLLFEVQSRRTDFRLAPFRGSTDEALVLPRELAGIVPGTTHP